ncbi:MAG: hypothetical protein KBT36_16955, partial [Kurthia sp.]|nr:hypothetical protein [Candidatus Kurthia equi]
MKRQLIAMGLATVLTVPSWIIAAHPLDASAKQVTVSKKAKAVITKIKAINKKKSNYIKATQAAQTAYNKLSKADKKKVSNYKTLKKHIKVIKPIVTKVNKLKKDTATLTNSNYKTKITKIAASYKSLNAAGKAYVPASTVSKINTYTKLNTASTSMKKLVTLSSSTGDFVTGEDVVELKNGTAILNFITAYEKLTDNQKRLLGGSKEAITILLAVKPIVKKAVAYDASYAKLKQANTGYLKQAYELNNTYELAKGSEESVTVSYKSGTGTATKTKSVADYTTNDAKLKTLDTEIKVGVDLKDAFEKTVKDLPNDTDTATTQLDLVNKAVAAYKVANQNIKVAGSIIGKPIDIVDKKVLTEYKKYEAVPTVISQLKNLEDYTTKLNPLLTKEANFTAEEIDYMNNNGLISSDKKLNAVDKAIKDYLKLGTDQKTIVDNELPAVKLDYISDAASLKKGQTISKTYTDGLAKNDLAAMKKALDNYKEVVKNDDRAMRYVVQAPAMRILEKTYAEQLGHVEKFEQKMNTYTSLAGIKDTIAAYTVIEKDKPSALKLIDTQIAKDYILTKTVIDIDKLKPTEPKASETYTTKKLNNILAATKLYKKLTDRNKNIIDDLYNKLEDYSKEEKEIKQAMDIDKKYLALKPSTKSYNKNAKLVYSSYLDANEIVKPYIVYKNKILTLLNDYEPSQKTVDAFEIKVNEIYSEIPNGVTGQETITNIKNVKNDYEHKIMPYKKASDLLDPLVLKRYNEIIPIVDVYNKIFMLKKSPTTEVDRDAILTAIRAYEKLSALG